MQILESKGDIGVLAHPKSQVTAPKEFHFSTDVRLGPPSVADLFDKVFIDIHWCALRRWRQPGSLLGSPG